MAEKELVVKAKLVDEVSQPAEAMSNNVNKSFNNIKSSGNDVGKVADELIKKFGGMYAITKVGEYFKNVTIAAGEAAQTQAKLATILDATASSSGQTMSSLAQLGEEMQKLTLYDNDAAASAEQVLLKFTNVAGQAFPSAIKASADLATVMGTDLASATTLVGKALNNPIEGLGALNRVGIQFTDSQKEMIKTLVESGDTIGAQNIVLDKLKNTMGGAAEAAAKAGLGPFTQMTNAIDDMNKAIGAELLPYIVDFSKSITDNIEPISAVFVGTFRAVIGVFQMVAAEITFYVGLMLKEFELLWNGALSTFEAILGAASKMADWLPGDMGKAKIDAAAQSLKDMHVELSGVAFEAAAGLFVDAGNSFGSIGKKKGGGTPETTADGRTIRTGGTVEGGSMGPTKEQIEAAKAAAKEAFDYQVSSAQQTFSILQEQEKQYEDNKIANIQDAAARQYAIIDKAQAAELELYKNKQVTDITGIVKNKQMIAEVTTKYNNQREAVDTEMMGKMASVSQKYEDMMVANVSDKVQQKLIINDMAQQEELKQLENEYTNKLVTEENYQIYKNEIQQKYSDQRKEIEQQELLNSISNTQSIFGQLSSIINTFYQAKSNNIDKDKNKQIEEIKNSKKTAEEKAKLIEQINIQAEQAQKEAGEKQKAVSIITAVINTALAVTQALASTAPPVSYVLAALSLAAGVAQIALISSQKYATGGDFVTSGPRTITVGDNPGGRERVQITPIGSPNLYGPQGGSDFPAVDFSINISGNADSATVDLISERREEQLYKFKNMYNELKYQGQL